MEDHGRDSRPKVGSPARRRPPEVPPGLVDACREGDRQAFETLFRMTKDFVFSVALYTVADREAAADVAQDVFLKLLRRIRAFEGRSRFSTWLYRVTVREALDRHRGRRPALALDEVAEAELGPSPRSSPEAATARRRDRERVRRAIARLSPKLRGPLVLRHLLGLSYREIAEELSIPPGTVASRLSRAQEALARELEDG